MNAFLAMLQHLPSLLKAKELEPLNKKLNTNKNIS